MSRVSPIAIGLMLWTVAAVAGPFAPAPGHPDSTAVPMHDERIIGWATGWTNFNEGAHLDPEWAEPERALGAAAGTIEDVVSLGDGGDITYTFSPPIVNGPGYDFAVFGNAFSDSQFLELAYVEVSSNGEDFFRFQNESLTPTNVPFWGPADMDPTLIDGLAGKYPVGYGVPFDLADLDPAPGLDLNNIGFVRLVDIIGDGSYTDSYGRAIFDPHPTMGSAGFDLDAIGVLQQAGPLHDWRIAHFGAAAGSSAAANNASWSDDGIPNIAKYVWNLDPLEAAGHVPVSLDIYRTNGTSYARVRYVQRDGLTDVEVGVESVPDLTAVDWTQNAHSFTTTLYEVTGTGTVMQAVSPTPVDTQQFIRWQFRWAP